MFNIIDFIRIVEFSAVRVCFYIAKEQCVVYLIHPASSYDLEFRIQFS